MTFSKKSQLAVAIASLLAFNLSTAEAARVVGPQGPQGPQGKQGLKGEKGDKGDRGQDGAGVASGIENGDTLVWNTEQKKWVRSKGQSGLPSQATPGQTIVWNGTQWSAQQPERLPQGQSDGQTLVWNQNENQWQVSSSAGAGKKYQIGDELHLPTVGQYAINAVIFYVDASGEHGLATTYQDEPGVTPSAPGEKYTWAQAITIAESHNDSEKNPECFGSINNTNPNPNITVDYALRTPTCWHLPTKTELELLYEQKNVVGGFADDYYWSSSEFDSTYAWGQSFYNGYQSYVNKSLMLPVRAVRAF